MSENIFFRQVAIEGFRGFRDRVEVETDASAIVITGANGTGKTSFFDAIQWLLLGDLERLSSMARRPRDDYIVNQYRLPGPAVVEAELLVKQGAEGEMPITLRRSGRQKSNLLEWVDRSERLLGPEAERRLQEALLPGNSISLPTALLKSALLQQDVMRDVLEAKESERFQHLNALLGLEVLSAFEQAAKSLAKERGEATAQTGAQLEALRAEQEGTESRLAAVRLRQQQLPAVDVARSRLAETAIRVRAALGITDDLRSLSPESLASFRQAIAVELVVLDEVQSRWPSVLRELGEIPPSSEDSLREVSRQIEAAEEAIDEQTQILAEVTREQNALRRMADQVSRLAADAVPLLSDRCPVCGQAIDRETIERRLIAGAEAPAEFTHLAEREEAARAEIDRARTALETAQSTASTIRRWLARRRELEVEMTRLRDRLAAATSALPGITFPNLLDVNYDEERTQSVTVGLKSIADSIDFYLAALRSTDEGALERQLLSELESVSERVAEVAARLELLESTERRAAQLAAASGEAAVRIVQKRFTALRPLIRDVYARLDPHPSFKVLDLHSDFYRLKGATRPVVRDEEEDVEADPMLIFASSQANIVALSYFLALGWASGDRNLPFVLMDDPLQSMDDVNVLGLADLCRFARRQRQLIISTHEARFAALLERKLASRQPGQRTIVLRFLGWDRRGPAIVTEEIPSQVELSEPRVALPAN